VALSAQLGQQLVQQHHLAARMHQLVQLAGKLRTSLQLAPHDVFLQPSAQELQGTQGWSDTVASLWAHTSSSRHGSGVGAGGKQILLIAMRAYGVGGEGESVGGEQAQQDYKPPGPPNMPLTGWQHTLRSSIARLRMPGMFLVEAPANSCKRVAVKKQGQAQKSHRERQVRLKLTRFA
jgi:hypothetical protein